MKKLAVAFALVLASFALAACGSSSSDSSSTSAETTSAGQSGSGPAGGKESGGATAKSKSASTATAVAFEADPAGGLAYTSDTASSKSGKVTIDFTNPQPLSHDVAFEDAQGKTIGKTELIAEGSNSAVVDLKPGKYTFYCTVPGHREAGMEGTLTVK